jgi:hypothetical protein
MANKSSTSSTIFVQIYNYAMYGTVLYVFRIRIGNTDQDPTVIKLAYFNT